MFLALFQLVFNAAALWVAQYLGTGLIITGGLKNYLIAGVILGILNLGLKPILKTITFPLIILTLGLFNLVLNGLMLWLVDYFFVFVSIPTWQALVWSTLVIWFVNLIFNQAAKGLAASDDHE